jgi:inhibitor of KinA sporulation pathway (predicted exonuclease)
MSVLIALHSHLIKRSALNAVFSYCRQMKFKVNVLLVDGGEALSPVLAEFMARLKQAGLSGQLYHQTGPLDQAVLEHASRNKDIRLILVDSMKNWGTAVSLKALTQPIGLLGSVVAA